MVIKVFDSQKNMFVLYLKCYPKQDLIIPFGCLCKASTARFLKDILWDYMLYTWNYQYIINGDKRFNIAEFCQQTFIHNSLLFNLLIHCT